MTPPHLQIDRKDANYRPLPFEKGLKDKTIIPQNISNSGEELPIEPNQSTWVDYTRKVILGTFIAGAAAALLYTGYQGVKQVSDAKQASKTAQVAQKTIPAHHIDMYGVGNQTVYVFDDKVAGEVYVIPPNTRTTPLGLLQSDFRTGLNRIGYDNNMLTKIVSELNGKKDDYLHINQGATYMGLRPAKQDLSSITNSPSYDTVPVEKKQNYNPGPKQ